MSKEKIYSAQTLKLCGMMGVGFMTLVLLLLGAEYYCLNKTATKVLGLKEEYRSYVMALKRALREKTRETAKDEKSDVKKNAIDEEIVRKNSPFCSTNDWVDSEAQTSSFMVVNREPQYLRDNALAYAKQHDLDKLLTKMFDSQDWERASKKKIVVKQRVKKKKKGPISGSSTRPAVFEEGAKATKVDRDFLFSYPIERSKFWLSSPFGPRKIGKNAWKFHYGVDMAAPRGTPVQAAASGIVIESSHNLKGYGNYVVILHNHKYKTRYAHLHARYVKCGQEVQRGTVIGSVGATGNVVSRSKDGSHLHFEVYSFGRRINPLSVLI